MALKLTCYIGVSQNIKPMVLNLYGIFYNFLAGLEAKTSKYARALQRVKISHKALSEALM
jgi:hypothetical protein